MTARTYDELFEKKPKRVKPKPVLSLEETLTGRFTAVDQAGRVYFYPSTYDMNAVVDFMRLMERKGDVTLDEESITWFRALRAFGEFSVRAGSLSERSFAAEAGRTDLTGDITGSDHVPVPLRSESDLASLGGDPTGGAGLSAAPVPRAVAVNDEPASPPSEIGASGAAAAGRTGAPIQHLRLVN